MELENYKFQNYPDKLEFEKQSTIDKVQSTMKVDLPFVPLR